MILQQLLRYHLLLNIIPQHLCTSQLMRFIKYFHLPFQTYTIAKRKYKYWVIFAIYLLRIIDRLQLPNLKRLSGALKTHRNGCDNQQQSVVAYIIT